jgi:SulP family sulfate permease
MIRLQHSGYRSRSLGTDLTLGFFYGLSLSLWSYVYAAIVFSGVLAVFMPVGVLVMLMGWVLVSVWVILVSREPLHSASTDDQAVVIFGSIASLMIVYLGGEASSSRGLATMLFIMAATTLLFAASCYAVGRFRLSRILEMLPFPVVCGFMASVGWLLLDAGFGVAADLSITPSLLADLAASEHLPQLGLSVALGGALLWITSRVDRSWIMPAASLVIVAAYHAVALSKGISHADQLAGGWLFDVPRAGGGAFGMLATLSPADIDWPFVLAALPLMLTVLLISMLYVSMTVTRLKGESSERLDIGEEFKILATGNLFSAAVCCPPGYTDVTVTRMYRKFGASSRWFVLASSLVGLAIAVFGGSIIGYLPKLLMSASIFLFAFSMLSDWLYYKLRGFEPGEYLIVYVILTVTILVGFLQAVGTGILLTVLLFVIRYSRISAIQSRHTLGDQRSSVERSRAAGRLLDREGSGVIIYHLRGFLFFGTANAICDRILETEGLAAGGCSAILMDMKRVTGIDVSALNTFAQIKAQCDTAGVSLAYSAVPPGTGEKLRAVGAVTVEEGRSLVFEEDDFAMEYLEDRLLRQGGVDSGRLKIRDLLKSVFPEPERIELFLGALEREEISGGSVLFEQGDPDSGFYIVESGALSAFITTGSGTRMRVKKFNAGSLVGELSAYLGDRHRTATVIADRDAVIYHLDTRKLDSPEADGHELRSCIHELVSTALAERVDFMNRRLLVESGG